MRSAWSGRSGGRSSSASRLRRSCRPGCRGAGWRTRSADAASARSRLPTGLGAASSSCSYAAIAIAKSLFEGSEPRVSAMIVPVRLDESRLRARARMWVFVGWRFTAAEFVGGLVLIVLLWLALARWCRVGERKRRAPMPSRREAGHVHHTASSSDRSVACAAADGRCRRGPTSRTTSAPTGRCSGRRSSPASSSPATSRRCRPTFFNSALPDGRVGTSSDRRECDRRADRRRARVRLLDRQRSARGGSLERRHLVLRRACVLYADLIIIPIVFAYRKFYGGRFAAGSLRSCSGRWSSRRSPSTGCSRCSAGCRLTRPSLASISERPITWNYTAILNLIFLAVFAVLIGLTMRRGARDPVCGMTVDRHAGLPTSSHGRRTVYFCSTHCQSTFDANPEEYT